MTSDEKIGPVLGANVTITRRYLALVCGPAGEEVMWIDQDGTCHLVDGRTIEEVVHIAMERPEFTGPFLAAVLKEALEATRLREEKRLLIAALDDFLGAEIDDPQGMGRHLEEAFDRAAALLRSLENETKK